MAQSFEYDHPQYLARRDQTMPLPATASSTSGYLVSAFPVQVSAATITIITAGTNTGNTYAAVAGTTTLGTYSASTAAAGSQSTLTASAPISLAAKATSYVVKGNDATGVALVTWEWKPTINGDVTY